MPTTRFHRVIAIDPDLTASGVAILDVDERRFTFTGSKSFADLVDLFNDEFSPLNDTQPAKVFIEAGWMETKSNFRHKWNGARAERIAHDVGQNHATGKLLAEMARHIGFDVDLVHPLRKGWHGTDGKITHDELMAFTHAGMKHTNQDQRDAMLLAWVCANLPIRIAVCR